MAKKKKTSNKKMKVDFSKTSGRLNLPVGEYEMNLIDAEFGTNENTGNPQMEATFEVTSGKFKGQKPKAWIPCTENSLWRLRNFLEALGVEIDSDSAFEVDLDEVVDEADGVIGIVEQSEYNGKVTNKLSDFMPSDGNSSSDDDDEDEDDDDEEKISEADIKKMDADELEELCDEYDLDVDLDDHKTIKKKREAVIKAYKESESDDDDEDDDDETYSKDQVNSMGTKELQALVDKHDLDVELTGNTKKKRKTVIEALDDEDLLDE